MAQSSILAVPQLADGQTQAFTTVNEAIAILEQAMNRKLSIDTANANTSVTLEQMTRNAYFVFTGATSGIQITYPGYTESPSNVSSPSTARLFVVENTGTGTLTVKTDRSGGTTISVIGSEICIAYIDGRDVKKILSSTGGIGGTGTFTVAAYIAGTIPPATEIMRYTCTETTTFSDNFSGARGSLAVNPTASVTFTVYRNASAIGTIVISTGGAFTFATTGSTNEVFAAGDVLSVVTGASDATAANVSFTFKGTR